MSNLTTILGWTTIFGISGVVYYLSRRTTPGGRQQNNKVDRRSETATPFRQTRQQADTNDTGVSSGNDKVAGDKKAKTKKKTRSKVSTSAPAIQSSAKQTPPALQASHNLDDDEESDDDVKFAEEFARAQAGQVAPSKAQNASKQKSSKLSKIEKGLSMDTSGTSAQSSDVAADDDTSNSEMASRSYVGSHEVSDMLEAPQAGPSSIRISAPTKPAPQKKKASAAAEPALTKTQKKNRRKNEEKAAENQAAETERKALAEAHRRQVRITEGRPAKDGTAFLAANPPKKFSEAGASGTSSVKPETSRPIEREELLDTFNAPSVNHSSASTSRNTTEPKEIREDYNDDYQRAVHESLTEWEEVPSKKNKKNNIKSSNEIPNVPEPSVHESRNQPAVQAVKADTSRSTSSPRIVSETQHTPWADTHYVQAARHEEVEEWDVS